MTVFLVLLSYDYEGDFLVCDPCATRDLAMAKAQEYMVRLPNVGWEERTCRDDSSLFHRAWRGRGETLAVSEHEVIGS